VTWISV